MSLHELTDEQRAIRDLAARFADERIAPHAAAWDRAHTFPRALFGELGELGLMGVCVPEEHGGAGADFLSYVLVLEELSRADAGVGVTVAVHTSACALPLLAHGGERFVPALASGAELGAFALTEPGSGSDAGAMRTPRAWTGGSPARSSGSRTGRTPRRSSSSPRRRTPAPAPSSCAPARPASRSRARRRSWGSTPPRPPTSRSTDTPGERLGPPGGGMRIALATLDGGRIGIAAQAVGIAQAALELATGYARERTAFGGPIARFQAIQHKLADMQTEIEAARALTWRAARLKQAGRPHTVEGAQAKLFASAVARRQTGEAIQILGGYGYTKEFPAERYYRDAKVTEIYEGTSEIQKLVIARALLGSAMRDA